MSDQRFENKYVGDGTLPSAEDHAASQQPAPRGFRHLDGPTGNDRPPGVPRATHKTVVGADGNPVAEALSVRPQVVSDDPTA